MQNSSTMMYSNDNLYGSYSQNTNSNNKQERSDSVILTPPNTRQSKKSKKHNISTSSSSSSSSSNANSQANQNLIIQKIYAHVYCSKSCFQKVITNIPPFKLPTILDIIRDRMNKIKKIDVKENQTELLWTLCYVLTELPLLGDAIINKLGTQYQSNIFVSPTGEIPKISITDYLYRLVKFSPCSKECFIMITVYIDRIISKGNFIVTSHNIHRLLITSILIATKYIDDRFYNNQYYSHIGGITRNELNFLEIAYLNIMQFDLSCNLNEYLDYYSQLDSFVPQVRYLKKQSKSNSNNLNMNNNFNFNNNVNPIPQIPNFKSYTISIPMVSATSDQNNRIQSPGLTGKPINSSTTTAVGNKITIQTQNHKFIATTNDTSVKNPNTIIYPSNPISHHHHQHSHSCDSSITLSRRNSLTNNQFALPKSSSTTCISS
ncbi:Non-receptor tyrosine kinase [Tieghemostelium lacteum]|uniref:Non-receptor tyrosine kinase n=1 Tax=Tieghemostelium lacteum TaxID=361077 RepID=A0A152A6D9_TIELA|nr:Non-receptor tyrosine kinase [Tieghemostelium lacteum]|eukprot:KYR01802.1 Non-receptor tyrosine kinase [Tieghemostelium lacteum]